MKGIDRQTDRQLSEEIMAAVSEFRSNKDRIGKRILNCIVLPGTRSKVTSITHKLVVDVPRGSADTVPWHGPLSTRRRHVVLKLPGYHYPASL